MMRSVWISLLLISISSAQAMEPYWVGRVVGFVNEFEILVQGPPSDFANRPDVNFIVRTPLDAEHPGKVLAFAYSPDRVQDKAGVYRMHFRLAKRNQLILPGAVVEPLDLSRLDPTADESEDFKGTYELRGMGSKGVASRFKTLVTFGSLGGETASTLGNSERIIGLGFVGYGLSERVQANMYLPQTFVGEFNLGLKLKIFDDLAATVLSVSGQAFWSNRAEDYYGYVSLILDSYSTPNSMSSTRLTVWSEVPRSARLVPTYSEEHLAAELDVRYAYMLSNWMRIVMGPNFNFDRRTFGGYVGVVRPGKNFDLALGVRSTDFFNIEIKSGGILPVFDFWWRF